MRAPQRVALATRQDEFKLLQKPWQGILLLALHEVEAPGADEDEDDGPSLPARAPVARVLAVAVAVVGVLEAPWTTCRTWRTSWTTTPSLQPSDSRC